VAACALLLAAASGCAGSSDSAGSGDLTVESTDFTEGTLASSPTPPQDEPPGTTATTGTPAGASTEPAQEVGDGSSEEPGNVLLRVEGAPGTRFSGLCSVGDETSVVNGRVPRRYAYDVPEGRSFTCRIEKQSGGRGSLRVILVADDATRSVQQTKARGGTISVSYSD